MRNIGSREDARRRSAGESPQVLTIVRVVRRLGVVLGAALDCAIREMIAAQMIATAENLRDELKPLVDSLVHFTLEEVDSGEEV